VEENEGVIHHTLMSLPLPPTKLVKSGHGFHASWEPKEEVGADDEEYPAALELYEKLSRALCSDPAVKPWSLLRLPGTTNSKNADEPVECVVIHEGSPVDITEIQALADLLNGAPLFTPKERAHVGTNGTTPPESRGPVEVDEELAALMPGAVNATQCRVIPSMLRHSYHPDEVLTTVVDATMAMAEREGLGWSRDVEVAAVRKRIKSAYDLFLRDYDPSTGVIPDWLPGEFHDEWAKRLAEGYQPDMSYSRTGNWYVRSKNQGHTKVAVAAVNAAHAQPSGNDTGSTEAVADGNVVKLQVPKPKKVELREFVPLDEATLPPREWLYGRFYQRGTVSATISPGGSGKTTLGMVEAVAMATCRNLLGEQPEQRLRVWLHNGEDTMAELNRRLVAICKHYGIPQEELKGWFYMTSGNEFPLRVASGYNELKVDRDLLSLIREQIGLRQIDVVLLDPLITLHGVNEQDNGRMDTVIRLFAGIAADFECAIGLAHHTRKPLSGAVGDFGVDDMRGASAIRDAVRAARALNLMSTKDASDVGIPDHERTMHFRVDRAKGNNAPPSKAVWRKFVSVELANGDEVGVVEQWAVSGARRPGRGPGAGPQAGRGRVPATARPIRATGARRQPVQGEEPRPNHLRTGAGSHGRSHWQTAA
jgi:hypothetical protein